MNGEHRSAGKNTGWKPMLALVFRTIERSLRTTLKVIAVNPFWRRGGLRVPLQFGFSNPWPEVAKLA